MNALQLELQRLKLWGKSAHTKRIPAECFGWDNASLGRLLSRLYAGDGCMHFGAVPVITYGTVSRALADDLLLALDRFGVYGTININKTPMGDPFHVVTIADPVSQRRFIDSIGWMKPCNDLDGFMSALNRRCKFKDLPWRFEQVRAVVPVGEQQTYDIQVEQSRCYIANGIVSHNTIVKTGTPTTHKGDFHRSIQLNKRRQVGKGKRRQNHFESDWRECAKYNSNYGKFVKKEMLRLGEDSDEFQMSYSLKWLLERGMFTTTAVMEELGDLSMETVKAWHKTPVVVGIDPARRLDSTVVTVVWVDWDRPDEFGYFDHRILNWLEIHGDDWEAQYGQIVDFLANYDVLAVGVDAQGVGDAVAQRLKILLPSVEVHLLSSNTPDQSKRWKHLMQLMQRGQVRWPAHAKTRRTKLWQRFFHQMTEAEKHFQGQHILIAAPREAEAHDDFVDSLALATSMTADLTMPEVQVSRSPFYQ